MEKFIPFVAREKELSLLTQLISQKIVLEKLSLIECCALMTALKLKYPPLERFKLLSVLGGVPWYLELLKPTLNANENIKQLCFSKQGILVNEFNHIFRGLLFKKSEIYEHIVGLLAKVPCEYNKTAKLLNYPSGGPLSYYLKRLCILLKRKLSV